jgi:glycosyltransferase involved in cell wall biosynthesis
MATLAYGVDVWHKLLPERRWAFRRSDRVISISRFTADRAVAANGIAPDKVRILYNCLDPRFERYVRAEGAGSGLSMLTVGRMTLAEQYKGHDYVIRAMPALLRQFPHLVYDIVGDGDGRPSLERLADQVGVRDAVRFHGVVSEAELQRRYAEASLFIMPSRGEGFGFVFLEAMAHGVPAIGGNMDGTAEIILDGETGYLVDPTSEDAIATAASRLLGNEALRQRMGKKAWRRANEDFGYSAFRARLSSLLSELDPAIGALRGRE